MKMRIVITLFLLIFLGCSKNTVNESVIDGERITAANRLTDVESLAETYSRNLLLESITGENVEYNGTAAQWCYKFSSGGIAIDYYFHATSREVVLDSTSTIKIIGSGFISSTWFDSDEAL